MLAKHGGMYNRRHMERERGPSLRRQSRNAFPQLVPATHCRSTGALLTGATELLSLTPLLLALLVVVAVVMLLPLLLSIPTGALESAGQVAVQMTDAVVPQSAACTATSWIEPWSTCHDRAKRTHVSKRGQESVRARVRKAQREAVYHVSLHDD